MLTRKRLNKTPKTRSPSSKGCFFIESVTAAKRARLVAAARLYLTRRPDADCRFDVLLLDALEAGRVQWIRNAFSA